MPSLLSIARKRAPQGLAARAVLFTAGLVLASALLSAGAVILGQRFGLMALLLAPACLTLSAAWLTARLAKRALAPLAALTQYANQMNAQGRPAAPLKLDGNDEFAGLGAALNAMMARLDRAVRRLQDIAFIDAATQLPNHDRFAQQIDLAQKAPTEAGAALFVFELQRLPKLLQTLDTEAARDLLRTVAGLLAAALRAHEERDVIAARLSATEFAVFAPGLANAARAVAFGQRINDCLNQAFNWRAHHVSLGAYCGIAMAPRAGDAERLIRRARMALGAAQISPAGLKVYSPTLDRDALARLTLEREIRAALAGNEFRAYFQPKVNLATGRIEACEALARWERADRTIIGPNRFIPIAEESGLIGPLSRAIMNDACWKAASWARAGCPASVAVNVSALQFRDAGFAEQVLRCVREAGLAPELLELEITESVVMEDPERTLKLIQPLRAAGVRIAIDDFGCGHSNLAALSKLPFDVIKIDQQFVRALQHGEAQAPAIIDMILALAQSLNMDVVAEGIERRDEAAFMARRGCMWGQGFYYGAAVSAADFAAALQAQGGKRARAADAA
jgi:EAL domain-containing protein (putative c-di-GMP-specific phosphodiesterase class I)/GGDEF domain-containing protein